MLDSDSIIKYSQYLYMIPVNTIHIDVRERGNLKFAKLMVAGNSTLTRDMYGCVNRNILQTRPVNLPPLPRPPACTLNKIILWWDPGVSERL